MVATGPSRCKPASTRGPVNSVSADPGEIRSGRRRNSAGNEKVSGVGVPARVPAAGGATLRSRYSPSMRTSATLVGLVLLYAFSAGCADVSVGVGLSTRSTFSSRMQVEQDGGGLAILTASPSRVGVVQGISPSAPLRGIGPFASDAVRVGSLRQYPENTVVFGPEVVSRSAAAGQSATLARLIAGANDSGILLRDELAALGEALGLEYFLLCSVSTSEVRGDSRLNLLGLNAVRSAWTTCNLSMQLYHAPTGAMVWQSIGDCTGYSESVVASPVSMHTVMSDLAQAMIRDLVEGRSRTTLFWRENARDQVIDPDDTEGLDVDAEIDEPSVHDPAK